MIALDQAGAGLGRTRVVPPPAKLQPFIEFFWVQSGGAEEMRGRGWRIVPDAEPHLIVKRLLRGAPAARHTAVRVVGARSRHVDTDQRRRDWTVGARLRPGVLPLITGLPASDLTDRGATASDALGAAGRTLERDVEAARDAGDALDFLRETLVRRLAGATTPDPRIRGLMRLLRTQDAGPRARAAVRGLADRLGVAERTLRQRCADDVGLSPVQIARVKRLHHALGLALGGLPVGGWARVAIRAGYYDQSHLIREFRQMLGEPPGDFVARSRPADRCHPSA